MEISEEKNLQIIWKYLENDNKLYGNIGWKTNKLHGSANSLLGFILQFAGHSSSRANQFHLINYVCWIFLYFTIMSLLFTFVGYFCIGY